MLIDTASDEAVLLKASSASSPIFMTAGMHMKHHGHLYFVEHSPKILEARMTSIKPRKSGQSQHNNKPSDSKA